MKKILLSAIMAIVCVGTASAQYDFSQISGKCGEDLIWTFDGQTLMIQNVNKKYTPMPMADYDTKKVAPWTKKKLDVQKVVIGAFITRIGSCAFAECRNLRTVEFETQQVETIGWGAFLNCRKLDNLSFPTSLTSIETIAFANCFSISTLTIPEHCKVGDMAFLSCNKLSRLSIAKTANLGDAVFASEEYDIDGNVVAHKYYNRELIKMPEEITVQNCEQYGLDTETVGNFIKRRGFILDSNYDDITSNVDSMIPASSDRRSDIYALIIGNQNYSRYNTTSPDVNYAIHDARVFKEYCEKTIGVPSENIHVYEDATKHVILEESIDWLSHIDNRGDKRLIVYYAGHGVPYTSNENKTAEAYMLPVDVKGEKPYLGISLGDFYSKIGDLAFNQTSVFLDACFSGMGRSNRPVVKGQRSIEIETDDEKVTSNNMVVFSAAQGNETAQGYAAQGHGLFTYFLLNKLKETRGFVSYKELSDYIKDNVTKTSLRMATQKKQTPKTSSSNDSSWEGWFF